MAAAKDEADRGEVPRIPDGLAAELARAAERAQRTQNAASDSVPTQAKQKMQDVWKVLHVTTEAAQEAVDGALRIPTGAAEKIRRSGDDFRAGVRQYTDALGEAEAAVV